MWKKVLIISIGLTNAADAHCYARWYYPWPQNCGGIYSRQSYRHSIVRSINSDTLVHVNAYDIPLPDLSGIWINSTETEEQLELMEGLDRIKAIKSLSNN
jgi:hypothetical protein